MMLMYGQLSQQRQNSLDRIEESNSRFSSQELRDLDKVITIIRTLGWSNQRTSMSQPTWEFTISKLRTGREGKTKLISWKTLAIKLALIRNHRGSSSTIFSLGRSCNLLQAQVSIRQGLENRDLKLRRKRGKECQAKGELSSIHVKESSALELTLI